MRPVIQRELQVASRRTQTWHLRLVFGVGAMLAFAFGLAIPDVPPRERGLVVLVSLAGCGFCLSLFAGAYLTADAISAEKREGTLGLLFLTPLKGWQIVLGKAATHSLQVTYALLGTLPLLFLPLLMGGVVWTEVTRILLVFLATLLLSLSVGVCWSTVGTRAQTTVLASVISMILITLAPWLWPFLEGLFTPRFGRLSGAPQISPMTALVFAFQTNFQMRGSRLLPGTTGAFVFWGSIVLSLGLSGSLLALSSQLLRRLWHQTEAGTQARTAARRQTPPRLRSAARAGLSSLRDHEPLAWLAQARLRESAWLRVFRWIAVCFFLIMLVTSVATRHWEVGFVTAFCTAYVLHLLTRIQLAVSATEQMAEDRRSGGLEALLSTPVTDGDVIDAHHRSLKCAFRRPLLVLLGMNGALQLCALVFHEHLQMDHGPGLIFSVAFVGGALVTLSDFAALRWFGLRESLRSATHLKAAAISLVRLYAVAWASMALLIPVALQMNEEEIVALIFSLWVLLCLLVNATYCFLSRRWLAAGLRKRVSEA